MAGQEVRSLPPRSAVLWKSSARWLSPLGIRMPLESRLVKRLAHRWKGRFLVTVYGGRELVIRLDEPAGQGQAVYFSPVYERGTTAVLSWFLRPGAMLVDVGANIGWYTTLGAGLVGSTGRVFAFEPHPVAFTDLRANVEVNGLGNVVLQQVAISDETARVTLVTPEGSPISQTYTTGGLEKAPKGFQVEARTLDSVLDEYRELLLGRPCLVKVDVEGGEAGVVAGAERMTREMNPIWVVEANPESAARANRKTSAPFELLAERGYDHFFAVDMHKGRAMLALPFVELFRPGRACVTRRVAPLELDDESAGYVENIACLHSGYHGREIELLMQHSSWWAWALGG